MHGAAVVFAALSVLLGAKEPSQTRQSAGSFLQIAKQAAQAREAGRLADAIRLYSDGVRLRPAWDEGWWSLGTLYYDEDRFEEARRALARFVQLAENPAPALGLLALCEYETREYDLAVGHFTEWAAKKPPASNELLTVAYFHWALLLIRKGEFERATVLLNARARLGNSGPELEEAMGLAALRMARLPEEYPPEEREPVWLAGRAAMQTALQRPERADQEARMLLRHYDAHPNVHYFLGTVLLDSHQSDAAAKQFERERQISPRHAAAMVQLAMFHLGNGEAAQALELARKAADIEPGNFPAHKTMGDALLQLERYADGTRELEIARNLAPESAAVHFSLARAYQQMGRDTDAARERALFTKLKERERERTSK